MSSNWRRSACAMVTVRLWRRGKMRSASWGQKLAIAVLAGVMVAQAQDAEKTEAPKPAGDSAAAQKPSEKAMPAPAKGSTANDSDYVIGTEDVLFINVWRENEMSRSVPVRPDGKISLPLIGEFEAAGATPKQLQAKIAKQLETILTNPDVTVMVVEMRSQKITIMGEVGKPGSYPLQKPMSVLEGLA